MKIEDDKLTRSKDVKRMKPDIMSSKPMKMAAQKPEWQGKAACSMEQDCIATSNRRRIYTNENNKQNFKSIHNSMDPLPKFVDKNALATKLTPIMKRKWFTKDKKALEKSLIIWNPPGFGQHPKSGVPLCCRVESYTLSSVSTIERYTATQSLMHQTTCSKRDQKHDLYPWCNVEWKSSLPVIANVEKLLTRVCKCVVVRSTLWCLYVPTSCKDCKRVLTRGSGMISMRMRQQRRFIVLTNRLIISKFSYKTPNPSSRYDSNLIAFA